MLSIDNTTNENDVNTSAGVNDFHEIEYSDADDPRSAVSTYAEIKQDNVTLRDHDEVRTKTFDIELDKHLFEMRPDTKLVFVDIPGINEAGSSKKYLDYINDNWETFDCVVLIMDALQGVNLEEQVTLLQLVAINIKEKRDLPVIILGNKVDDPEDEEIRHLVQEVRSQVETTFDVDCRIGALNELLNMKGTSPNLKSFPAFLTISAGDAFVYRCASHLNLDDFQKLDKELINKIGQHEVGPRMWKRLSPQDKYTTAFAAVSKQSEYDERLEATNFDKFLKVLAVAVGGHVTQTSFLVSQGEVTKKNVDWNEDIILQLTCILDRSRAVGQPTSMLADTFFEMYNKQKDKAFLTLEGKMDTSGMISAMDQLIRFIEVLNKEIHRELGGSYSPKWKENEARAITMMKQMITHQYHVIILKFRSWDSQNWALMMTRQTEGEWDWNGRGWRSRMNGGELVNVGKPNNPPDVDSAIYWAKFGDVWVHRFTREKVQGNATLASKNRNGKRCHRMIGAP